MDGQGLDDQGARRTLGEAIKTRRQELGWTQDELADRVAAHGDPAFRQSDVSRLERGKVALPRRERLEHIAAVLGLSLGELLARSGWSGWSDWSTVLATVPAHAVGGSRVATELPGDPHGLVLENREMAHQTVPGAPAVRDARLQQALAEAWHTVARSEQLMRQAEALRAMYEQPLLACTVRSRAAE